MKVHKLSVMNFIIVFNKHPIQGGNLIAKMLFGLLYPTNCEKLSYSYESLHGLSTPSFTCY